MVNSNQSENKNGIPVGCVPAARRPYAGVCFPGGGLPGPGGVCLIRGGYGIPACTEADTLPPPPVDSHTPVKNITLATTSLRPVIKKKKLMEEHQV